MSPASSGPPAAQGLVLLMRADCGLCEEMLAALHALAARRVLPPLRLQDVDADPELQRRYGLKIPVLLWQGTPVCRTRFDADELLTALARRGPPGPPGPAVGN